MPDPASLRAENARLREALEAMMEGCVWKEAHLFFDGTPIAAGWSTIRMPSEEALNKARAALAGKDEG